MSKRKGSAQKSEKKRQRRQNVKNVNNKNRLHQHVECEDDSFLPIHPPPALGYGVKYEKHGWKICLLCVYDFNRVISAVRHHAGL